jgi:arsenate reductase-like glutaredoxin family protein
MEKFNLQDKYVKFNTYEILLYNKKNNETTRKKLSNVTDEFCEFIFLDFINHEISRKKLQRILYSYYANKKSILSRRQSKKSKKTFTNANGSHGIMVKDDAKTLSSVKRIIKYLNNIMFEINEVK